MAVVAPAAVAASVVWDGSMLCGSGVDGGVFEGIGVGVADGEGVGSGDGVGVGDGGGGVYSHSGSSMVTLEMSKGVISG